MAKVKARSLKSVFANCKEFDERPEVLALFKNIVRELLNLKKLLKKINGHWAAEDCVYRFFHGSFKIHRIQDLTMEIVEMFKGLAPVGFPPNTMMKLIEKETGKPAPALNTWFLKIVEEGTGKEFDLSQNKEWLKHTRPMVEAFFHARYFLELIVRYGKELKKPPCMLPSGWALVLYLFNLR